MHPIRWCPFCGEILRLHVEQYPSGLYRVVCEKCGTLGPLRNTKKDAIGVWNNHYQDHGISYGHEPRPGDGHEKTCGKCTYWNSPTGYMGFCPIWQIEVARSDMCRFVKWGDYWDKNKEDPRTEE